ncbi:hypothetical protein SAMN05421736_10950 [Evansella caseinilytica]|uniref:DUF4367 domain-containing protein n=1 Tax=Evansella caseinilytica TaxID=1503961 RepID=A0A1H3RTS1_9BACI|nr:hypothetical protein [Evansella caseinilytica]SDZ29096.1 hypothetical protein SAMN05421736_10950 [Evansella caseinilytica]
MKCKRWMKLSSLVVFVLLLSACAVSEESALEHAKSLFADKIVQEKKTTSYENSDISFYVPSFTEVSVVDDYNIVMEQGDHILLLFLNDKQKYENEEELLNELLIESDPLIIEIGEHGGEQGYFVAAPYEEEEQYKLVVGYNGAKVTTVTTLSEMNDIAEMMFDIVQSVKRGQ